MGVVGLGLLFGHHDAGMAVGMVERMGEIVTDLHGVSDIFGNVVGSTLGGI